MGQAKRAVLRISNFDVIILCSCRPTENITLMKKYHGTLYHGTIVPWCICTVVNCTMV